MRDTIDLAVMLAQWAIIVALFAVVQFGPPLALLALAWWLSG